MTNTGLDSFDTTIQKTNQILKDIEGRFGWENRRDQAYDALRAVLITLRDRLTINEAVNLGAQLPMLIRGFYYEGWRPSEVPKKWDQEEFLAEVRKKFPLSIKQSTTDLIQGVMRSLANNIGKGEMQDILSNLPKDLKTLFKID